MYVCACMYVCMFMWVNCEFGCMNAEVREHWCRYRFLPSPFLETERLLSFTIAYSRLVDLRTPGDSPVSFSLVHKGELDPQCPCGGKAVTVHPSKLRIGKAQAPCTMRHAVSSAALHPLPISHHSSYCIVFAVLRHNPIMHSSLQFEIFLHHLPKGWDGKYMLPLPTHLQLLNNMPWFQHTYY